MKHQFGKILSVMLIFCSMLFYIQSRQLWWVFLVMGILISLSVVGMEAKEK